MGLQRLLVVGYGQIILPLRGIHIGNFIQQPRGPSPGQKPFVNFVNFLVVFEGLFVITEGEVGAAEIHKGVSNIYFATDFFVESHALQVMIHCLGEVSLLVMKVSHFYR